MDSRKRSKPGANGEPFGVAMAMMLVFALIGLVLGVFIPRRGAGTEQPIESATAGVP